jgi:hypothetical protein
MVSMHFSHTKVKGLFFDGNLYFSGFDYFIAQLPSHIPTHILSIRSDTSLPRAVSILHLQAHHRTARPFPTEPTFASHAVVSGRSGLIAVSLPALP